MLNNNSAMKLLIVSATSLEIKPFVTEMGKGRLMKNRVTRYRYKNFQIDVLVTGVGMVTTAVATTIALARYKYDVVFNVGICGSFNREIPIGTVLNITSDCLPETGAEDGEHFLSIIDLKLLDQDEFPFEGGKLVNDSVFKSSLINGLLIAAGATVNTVHGNTSSINTFLARHKVDVESMEGAAFMYSCKMNLIRHLQIRSVSNYIEDRNVSNWDIPLAVNNLNRFILDLLNE
jgi:futalosine hydrolase